MIFRICDFFSRFPKILNKEIQKIKSPATIKKRKISTIKHEMALKTVIFIFVFVFPCYYEYLSQEQQIFRVKSSKNKILHIPSLLFRNDIIFGFEMGCESENIPQGRSYENDNIHITNCFFSRSSIYSGMGGIIFVNGGSYSMNVNHSMFYNCVSNNGGAIWFSSSSSFLRMICANRCSASYSFFAYFAASQLNQVEYLSVSNSSHTTSGCYPFAILSGDQRVDNTNNSMNSAFICSGIRINNPSSFTSSYCSFSNNKASNSRCLFFYSSSGTIIMLYANIVHNNSPIVDGVVYSDGGGSIKIMYCIFQNNHNYLFCTNMGSLEVFHSFIDHTSSLFSTSKLVSTSNCSLTQTITYQLQFYSSLFCNADIPIPLIIPDQTITETRFNTPEDTPISTIKYTAIRTLGQTPIDTLEYSPIRTLGQTPIDTLEFSPFNTLEFSPMNTLEFSPINTLEYSPIRTLGQTPIDTLVLTHINTLQYSPDYTAKESRLNTPEKTFESIKGSTNEYSPISSPRITPLKSSNTTLEFNQQDSIIFNIIFFTSGVLLLTLFSIVFVHISVFKTDKHDLSISSQEKNDELTSLSVTNDNSLWVKSMMEDIDDPFKDDSWI